MTFLAFEMSAESGEPIELFKIAIGSDVYAFTTSEDEVSIGTDTYEPIPSSRSGFRRAEGRGDSDMTVTVPATYDFVELYVSTVPTSLATISNLRLHRPDGTTPESVLQFKGRVTSVAFVDDLQEAEIVAIPLDKSLSKVIPRIKYSDTCSAFLFDENCKVDQAGFNYVGTISAVSGTTITVPGLASATSASFAVEGYVQIGSSEFRTVRAQSGDILTLDLPFPSSVDGLSATVFAGCDHIIDGDCDGKFDNVVNNQSFSFVPNKNPFQTGIT